MSNSNSQSSSKQREERLGVLFDAIIDELTEKISSGEAGPAHVNAAITLLKNNAITIDPKESDAPAATKLALLRMVTQDELKEAQGAP